MDRTDDTTEHIDDTFSALPHDAAKQVDNGDGTATSGQHEPLSPPDTPDTSYQEAGTAPTPDQPPRQKRGKPTLTRTDTHDLVFTEMGDGTTLPPSSDWRNVRTHHQLVSLFCRLRCLKSSTIDRAVAYCYCN